MLYICYATVIIWFMALFVVQLVPSRLTRGAGNSIYQKRYIYLTSFFLIFILAASIVSWHITPYKHNDLYRHYQVIDAMRSGGLPYNTPYDLGTDSSPLFLCTWLFKLVAILPCNNYLQVIAVLTVYAVFFYILRDYAIEHRAGIKVIALAVLIHFDLCLMSSVVSGIRNAMAFAFSALACYIDFYRENTPKNKIIAGLLYLLPAFMHPAALIIPALRGTLFLVKRFKWMVLVIPFWSVLASLAAKILTVIPIKLVQYVGKKLENNLIGRVSNVLDDWRLYLVRIALLLILLGLAIWLKRGKAVPAEQHFIDFILIVSLFTVGSTPLFNVFSRMLTFLSFLYLPVLHNVFLGTTRPRQKWGLTLLLSFFSAGLVAYNFVSLCSNMKLGL